MEPLVDETIEAEMPAALRLACMVVRVSFRSMVAVFPFMVTVPERSCLPFPSRVSTRGGRTRKAVALGPSGYLVLNSLSRFR